MDRIVSKGFAYNDVLLLPGHTDFDRDEIDVHTRFSRNIELDIPIVSAPMDRVTGYLMAESLARLGGIGIIHRNQSPDDQADEVAKVASQNLQVGAAVSTFPNDIARAYSLVEAGAVALVLDSAHGDTHHMVHAATRLKRELPGTDIIAGNIATTPAAERLEEAGADGLRVGMGPGSICTTRIISGMGVPQFTALENVYRSTIISGIPFIADGGITHSGDLPKAIGAGASTIMLGRLLAETFESPGDVISLPWAQVPKRFKDITESPAEIHHFKEYRGMGSLSAMQDGQRLHAGNEFHGKNYETDKLVAEGVEALVPISGSVEKVVTEFVEGLKSGMYYTGNRTITELQQNARFVEITHASVQESHPHDILVMHGGGNYRP